jgi:glycogen(starch) synthase
MKVRSRASSVRSGASTPGGGAFRSLSEDDLREADTALSHVQTDAMVAKLNGAH